MAHVTFIHGLVNNPGPQALLRSWTTALGLDVTTSMVYWADVPGLHAEVRQRTVDTLWQATNRPGPQIVISHGIGTVIAYDCLKRVDECPAVDAFFTLGSPLGLDHVRTRLRPEWTRRDGFPSETLVGPWRNLYDRLDPVCASNPLLAGDFKRNGKTMVQDIEVRMVCHQATGYLGSAVLRDELLTVLGN